MEKLASHLYLSVHSLPQEDHNDTDNASPDRYTRFSSAIPGQPHALLDSTQESPRALSAADHFGCSAHGSSRALPEVPLVQIATPHWVPPGAHTLQRGPQAALLWPRPRPKALGTGALFIEGDQQTLHPTRDQNQPHCGAKRVLQCCAWTSTHPAARRALIPTRQYPCATKARRGSRDNTIARVCWPCPSWCASAAPWFFWTFNGAFSLFQRDRPRRTTTAPWVASTARSVPGVLLPQLACWVVLPSFPQRAPYTPRGRPGDRTRETGGAKPPATGWPRVPLPRLTGGQGLQVRHPRRDLAVRVGLTHQHVVQRLLAQRHDDGFVAVERSAAAQECPLRMRLTQAVPQPGGRLTLAVLVCLPLTGADGCNSQGEAPRRACFDQRCRHYRRAARPLTAPSVPWQTRGTRDCRDLEGQESVPSSRSVEASPWCSPLGPVLLPSVAQPARRIFANRPGNRDWRNSGATPSSMARICVSEGPWGTPKMVSRLQRPRRCCIFQLQRSQAGGLKAPHGKTAQERVVQALVHTIRTPGGGEASKRVGQQSKHRLQGQTRSGAPRLSLLHVRCVAGRGPG